MDKNNKLVLYGSVLFLALGLAYYSSLKENVEEGETSWIGFNSKEIEQVVLEIEDKSINLYRNENGDFWVKFASQEVNDSQIVGDGPQEDMKLATEDSLEKKPSVFHHFKANQSSQNFFSFFNPLRAIRVIGDSDKFDLAGFGIVEKDKLTIKADKGRQFVLWLGKRSYGSRNIFAMDPTRKKLILINGTEIDNLRQADRKFFERLITNVDMEDVDRLVISSAGVEEEVIWHKKEDLKNNEAYWSDTRGEGDPKPSYRNWVTKLQRTKLKAYPTQEQTKALAKAEAVLRINLMARGSLLEKLEIKNLSHRDESGEVQSYWIYSDYLKSYAEIDENRAQTLVGDFREIVLVK